ncbi:MAG: cytochrome C biogenesis protein [bacterium]|nr:cytochrome C biogenesis protein [bacterium]
MIQQTFTALNEALLQSFWVAMLASVTWGILSILLSPCHLASIPLLIGFISSQQVASVKRTFVLSLTFAFGILLTIAAIGLVTAALGRLMGDVGTVGTYLVAGVFFVVGLYLMGVVNLPWSGMQLSSDRSSGVAAALILGLLFGIGLGPCTFAFMAPVLGVVFQTATTNFAGAVTLLFAFALGHCAVIVAAGMLAGHIQRYLDWSDKSRVTLWIKRVCGFLVILGGVYMIWKVS